MTVQPFWKSAYHPTKFFQVGIFVLWVGRRLHSHQVFLNFLNSPMTRTLEEGDKKIREKDDERHKLELKTTEDFLYTRNI